MHGLEYRDDEIFYFHSTAEMMETKNFFSPTYFGEDRFQKPILFYWFILISYNIFGVNWFAARICSVVFAALSVLLTWRIANKLFDQKVALLSAMILMTLSLFFRHAKNAVPDMALNFFIVLAMYAAMKFIEDPKKGSSSVLFFSSCALGFMVKGLAALVVPFATFILFAVLTNSKDLIKRIRFGRGTLILLILILPWFLYMIKVHGMDYLNYMLISETSDRIMNVEGKNIFLARMAAFLNHILFYLRILLTYFAPWSILALIAFPWTFWKLRSNDDDKESLLFLMIWFFVVLMMFSFMYYIISHYLLILTTPFAILISFFLLQEFESQKIFGRTVNALRKYFMATILSLLLFAFGFLIVFLVGFSKLWLIVISALYIYLLQVVIRSRTLSVPPMLVALTFILILSQTDLMSKAGLTAHGTLQKFAQTIHQYDEDSFGIGVGSQDVHEKEFQVYFDQRVEKVGRSNLEVSKKLLNDFFKRHEIAYCVMRLSDYQKLQIHLKPYSLEVLQKENIIRRRMYIDRDFFIALLKMEQNKVFHYLMEELILVKMDHHV